MAGKDYTGVGNDALDDVLLKIDNLNRRVKLLESNTRPTMPGYNFAAVPDDTQEGGPIPLNPAEGQVAVGRDDNQLYYYVNGEWRTPSTAAGAIARARLWQTYELYDTAGRYGGVVDLAPGSGMPSGMSYNHGITTDATVFGITIAGGVGIGATHFVQIKQPGIYIVTARFNYDDVPLDHTITKFDDTFLTYSIYDMAPDEEDGIHGEIRIDGFLGGLISFVTTIPPNGDVSAVPRYLYATLDNSSPTKTVRFGIPSYVDNSPINQSNTPCFMEIYRLGDTVSDDWNDWGFSTPPGVAT